MRSILSPRSLAVAGVVAVVFSASILVDRSQSSRTRPAPSLQEAARATMAAGSARLSGTVSAADGTAVTFEGVTSFATPEGELRARPAGAGAGSFIEVRTTGDGTWLRTPGIDRWIAVPQHEGGGAGGLPTGWGDVLRRLSRSTGVPASTDFDVDGRGRIRWMRFSQAGAGIEVAFRDFGVPVTVEPPPGSTP